MVLSECKIVSKEYVTDNQFIMGLECADIATRAKPGQFVNIDCEEFLRRPVSICKTENDIFYIGIRIKGKGTSNLAKKNPGDKVSVLGPLGNPFKIAKDKTCIAVGGGIGVYPLLFLLQEAKKSGIPAIAVCGYKSEDESFCLNILRELSDKVVFASECGDMDFHGNAVDALDDIITKNSALYTCGPSAMMKSVGEKALKHKIPCQVSLEERMGCGTGVCLVCACKVKLESGSSEYDYKRCCVEGPVFDAQEVLWD